MVNTIVAKTTIKTIVLKAKACASLASFSHEFVNLVTASSANSRMVSYVDDGIDFPGSVAAEMVSRTMALIFSTVWLPSPNFSCLLWM